MRWEALTASWADFPWLSAGSRRSPDRRWYRNHEHHAGIRHRGPGRSGSKGAGREDQGCPDPVPHGVGDPVRPGRDHRSRTCRDRLVTAGGAAFGLPGGDPAGDHHSCSVIFGGCRNFLWNLSGIESRKGGSDRRAAVRVKSAIPFKNLRG